MKTHFEHIHFAKLPTSDPKPSWQCHSNLTNFILGYISFYPSWNKYCFYPSNQTFYSQGCLKDIASFIDQLPK